ncbi:WD40 repeat domain-containing protein [[Actinomadura] parvosata]|nr:hypothetical protein [Nonomuraea sp. ATCC 55076]
MTDVAGARRSSTGFHRALPAALALCLVIVLGAGGLAWKREHDRTWAQERLALARGLALHAAETRDTDPVTARRFGAAAVALHPDEQTRAGLADTLLMWRREHLSGPTTGGDQDVALSADGQIALTEDADGVSVHDLKTWLDPEVAGKAGRLAVLKGHEGEVTAVALSPDGRTALVGGGDGATIVWDLLDPAHPRRETTLAGEVKDGPVRELALSDDSRTVVVGDDSGRMTVWDLTDTSRPARRSVTQADRDGVQDLALSADGRTAVTVGDGGSAVVWNLADLSDPVRTAEPAFSGGPVTAMAMSANGRTALVADPERVTVWNLDDPTAPGEVAGVDLPDITGMALTSDGRTALLASSLGDGILWNLSQPSRPVRLASLKGNTEDVNAVALSADGRAALMASSYRGVFVWNLSGLADLVADPLKAICRQSGNGETISRKEWTTFAGDADWSRYGGGEAALSVCAMR